MRVMVHVYEWQELRVEVRDGQRGSDQIGKDHRAPPSSKSRRTKF